MNRDMDAIRKIIIAVRDADSVVTKVEGVEDDVFKFNAMLLMEAGLVLGKHQPGSGMSGSPAPAAALIYRLTWDGFNFADSLKDDEIWGKAKKYILKPTASWTFDILKEFLKQEMSSKFGLHSVS